MNRRYSDPSPIYQPEVAAVKRLLQATHSSRGVLLYVDFHGHSRKKNIFFYGCADGRAAPQPRFGFEVEGEEPV